jgi:hypothetical protein
MTEGVEPDVGKATSPVLNGGREETCSNVPRLAPTQLPRSRCSPRLMPSIQHRSNRQKVFRLLQGCDRLGHVHLD